MASKVIKRPILAIRLGKLGDSVMCFPALSILRQRFPDHPLHVLTEHQNAGTFKMCSGVDHVLTVPALHYRRPCWSECLAILSSVLRLMIKRYHRVFDLQDHTLSTEVIARLIAPTRCMPFPGKWWWTRRRSALPDFMRNQVLLPMRQAFAQIAGEGNLVLTETMVLATLRLPHDDRQKAMAFWQDARLAGRFVVLCHLGASERHKTWPSAYFNLLFAHFSKDDNLRFVLTLGPYEPASEMRWPHNVLTVRPNSVSHLAALMELAQCFVSSDTGPSHLAVELGLPGAVLVQPQARIDLWYPQRCSLHLLQEVKAACATCDPLMAPRCGSCLEHIPFIQVAEIIERLRYREPTTP